MHALRILAGIAVGFVALAVAPSLPLLDVSSVHAQAKKKNDKKGPPGKELPKPAAERTPFTAAEDEGAVIPGIEDARVWGDQAADFARLLPQTAGAWLAISGGGSDGAYGAGVLTGWSDATGGRPEFTVVTGVSIGSLLAPFAFLGSRYDDEVRKSFTTITAADIFEDRVSRDSLLDFWPLRRQIEDRVTPKLLTEIAAEHARGRRLLVVTTNLDAGRRTVWNMGAIAANGSERALKLFRSILLASCAIPGFFSPVPIEVESKGKKIEELHSDGTLTAPFFVAPESMLSGSARPPITDLYVIINSKLTPEFKMVPPNVPGVLGQAIGTALTVGLRTQLMLVSGAAQRHGIALRVAHVDSAFNFPARGSFDGKYMQALYEVGIAAGKSGAAFEQAIPGISMHGSASPQ
ncbi:MAG: patatin-like phospholipase family protein [Xanthobacteraceae bacterium]